MNHDKLVLLEKELSDLKKEIGYCSCAFVK